MDKDNKVLNAGYIYICCRSCMEKGGDPPAKVKIAKNKGSEWTEFNHAGCIADFLLDHSDCKISDICLMFEVDNG